MITSREKYPIPTSKAIIRKSESEYLLLRVITSGNEILTLPGGRLEADESPEQAVVREVQEETGINVNVHGLCDSYMYQTPFRDNYTNSVAFVFACSYSGGDIKIPENNNEGIVGFTWVSKNELKVNDSIPGKIYDCIKTVENLFEW